MDRSGRTHNTMVTHCFVHQSEENIEQKNEFQIIEQMTIYLSSSLIELSNPPKFYLAK